MVKVMNRHNLYTSSFDGKKGAFIVLAKFIAFWALILTFFFVKISPQYLYGYMASLIDKVERIELIDEPKIVLIGNSNVAFGIRSELIEEALGMPVVNMGLHGGLGNAFHEEMARLNINAGDIIIICHSDFGGANDMFKESAASLAWIAIENHIELWKILRWKDIPMMVKTFPTYMKKAINSCLNDGNDTYAYGGRMAFNKYGDNIYNETQEWHYDFPEGFISSVPPISDECVIRINSLNKYVLEKGGTLLIAGYPIAYGEAYPDVEAFDDFKNELSTELECEVISNYEDYFFEYRYFYDTYLHLTNEGALLRTNQLIEDLKKYLDSKNTNVSSYRFVFSKELRYNKSKSRKGAANMSERLTWEQTVEKYPDKWLALYNCKYDEKNDATLIEADILEVFNSWDDYYTFRDNNHNVSKKDTHARR